MSASADELFADLPAVRDHGDLSRQAILVQLAAFGQIRDRGSKSIPFPDQPGRSQCFYRSRSPPELFDSTAQVLLQAGALPFAHLHQTVQRGRGHIADGLEGEATLLFVRFLEQSAQLDQSLEVGLPIHAECGA